MVEGQRGENVKSKLRTVSKQLEVQESGVPLLYDGPAICKCGKCAMQEQSRRSRERAGVQKCWPSRGCVVLGKASGKVTVSGEGDQVE